MRCFDKLNKSGIRLNENRGINNSLMPELISFDWSLRDFFSSDESFNSLLKTRKTNEFCHKRLVACVLI